MVPGRRGLPESVLMETNRGSCRPGGDGQLVQEFAASDRASPRLFPLALRNTKQGSGALHHDNGTMIPDGGALVARCFVALGKARCGEGGAPAAFSHQKIL
jgi:hypothetical protein